MAYVTQDRCPKEAFGKFVRRRKAAFKGLIILLSLAIIGSPIVMMANKSEAYGGALASYYSLWGEVTASGDLLTAEDWTTAHPQAGTAYMPFGQKLTVCYRWGCARGVTVTDVGPAAWTGRTLDVNKPVADRIGLTQDGVGTVTWWKTGYDPHYRYK